MTAYTQHTTQSSSASYHTDFRQQMVRWTKSSFLGLVPKSGKNQWDYEVGNYYIALPVQRYSIIRTLFKQVWRKIFWTLVGDTVEGHARAGFETKKLTREMTTALGGYITRLSTTTFTFRLMAAGVAWMGIMFSHQQHSVLMQGGLIHQGLLPYSVRVVYEILLTDF